MKTRILVTGGGGFAAGNIVRLAAEDQSWEVHAIEVAEPPAVIKGIEWHPLDLLDEESLNAVFARVKPEVLVHAAAISDIDYCEANREMAERVNVGATSTLVRLSAAAGCRVIYFSTDSLFDGGRGRYTEEDEPRPLNFYAVTKLRSERFVMDHAADWVIVRPSLILGLPVWEKGNSFLWRMLRSMARGEEVRLPREEIRSPVDVVTLSRAVLELARGSYRGILHLSGNTALSRYEMGRRLAAAFGHAPELVVDQPPVVGTGRAPRPRDVSLCNDRARALLNTPMLDLEGAIELIRQSKGGMQ